MANPAKRSTISTTSLIAPSTSNVRLLDANVLRIGASIFNDTTKILYLKLGDVASPTSYTVQIISKAYFEIPYVWAGNIEGVWEEGVTGTGVLVTEFE